MATFQQFECFSEHLVEKVHDFRNDVLRVYLSDSAPNLATDTVKADLAEIPIQFGYTGPLDVQNTAARIGSVTSVVGVEVSWPASGGSFGPFRYVVLFNDTPTAPADPLIAVWDAGSSLTIEDGFTFAVTFGSSLFTVT